MAINKYGQKILGVKIIMRQIRSASTGKTDFIVGVYINHDPDPVVTMKGCDHVVDGVPMKAIMMAVKSGKLPAPECNVKTVAGYRQVSGIAVVVVDRQTVKSKKDLKL